MVRRFAPFASLLILACNALAQESGGSRPPLAKPVAVLSDAETVALTKTVRELLLKNLPDPVVQSDRGWGAQKDVTVGVDFRRDGLKLTSVPRKAPRNDGTWRRVAIRASNPDGTLAVGLLDVVSPEPGRVTFTAHIGMNCDIKFEQQVWRHGTRLYSGETRGRCRGALALHCEVTNRVEAKPGSLLPDVVFRLRVTSAEVFYEKLEVVHTAGVGGDAAKFLGAALIDTVKAVKPNVEKDLLTKANAAVVKAGDTKEVRVGLGKLLDGKAPTVSKGK